MTNAGKGTAPLLRSSFRVGCSVSDGGSAWVTLAYADIITLTLPVTVPAQVCPPSLQSKHTNPLPVQAETLGSKDVQIGAKEK